MTAKPDDPKRTTMTQKLSRHRRTIAAGTLIVGLAATGAAVAATTGSDPTLENAVTVETATASPAPRAPLPPKSPELRKDVVSRVALLRQEATAEDKVPPTYVPPSVEGNRLSLTRADLPYARRLSGVADTWVVPLESGALGLVTANGGVEFGREQLDAGTAVQVRSDGKGGSVLAGVVADGVDQVAVATAAGSEKTFDVRENTYVFTAAGSDERPISVAFESNGARKVARLSGLTSSAP